MTGCLCSKMIHDVFVHRFDANLSKVEEHKPKKPRKKTETKAQKVMTPGRTASTLTTTYISPTTTAKESVSDIFGLLSSDSEDEEEARRAARAAAKQGLTSSLTRRVADGVLRRTADLDGDTYVELRVYHTKDVLKAADWKERLEKAQIALKYQASSTTPELGDLKNFIKKVKAKFTGSGKFYADRKLV